MGQAQESEHSGLPYTVEFEEVDLERVDLAWDSCKRWIVPAFDYTNKVGEKDAFEMCAKGEVQLWRIWRDGQLAGSAITQMSIYSNDAKIISFMAFGGVDIKPWVHEFLEHIEKFALREGCSAVEMVGRKGWGKLFPDYRLSAWIYTKELT